MVAVYKCGPSGNQSATRGSTTSPWKGGHTAGHSEVIR